LLKVDFGTLGNIGLGINVDPGRNTDVTGPRLPYMILYNKYSGTFRFFGSLLGQMDGYETIRIELRIPKFSPDYVANPSFVPNAYESDLKATNLLSIQGDAVQPLDQETDENVMVVFAKATNNSNKFFWFDIPVAYDPCLCNIRSQLDITFAFVKTASINLNGTINGAIKTESKNDGTPKGVKVATTVIAAGVSTALAIKTGGAVINFQAYSDMVKLFKDIPGLSSEQEDNLEALSNYVDCGLKFAKVIKNDYKDVTASGTLTAAQKKAKYKAANNILDANTTFMSSLANGCNKKDNAATTINATANLSGTWTEEQTVAGTEIKLAMPGSKWDDRKRFIRSHTDTENDQKTIAAYPTYNERLGTFALLETPEIEVDRLDNTMARKIDDDFDEWEEYQTGLSIFKFSLKEDLKYTFNPKININLQKSKVLCRIVIRKISGSSFEDDFNFFNTRINPTPKDYSDEFGYVYCEKSSFNLDLKNMYASSSINSDYFISSVFVDINQFKEMPFVFVLNTSDNQKLKTLDSELMKNVFIQFKILTVSNDVSNDENISSYHLFTFPLKLKIQQITSPQNLSCSEFNAWLYNTYVPNLKSIFEYPFQSFFDGNKNYNSDITFTNNETITFDGVVTISAKLSTNPGKRVKIYSTMGFELEPGAEISSSIELIVGYPFEKVPQPPQTYSQVAAFCSDNTKYKAQEFSTAAIRREQEEYNRRRIEEEKKEELKERINYSIQPNPNTGFFSLSFNTMLASDALLKIKDLTGREVHQQLLPSNNSSFSIQTSGLVSGVYFVTVQVGNFVKTEKIIMQSP